MANARTRKGVCQWHRQQLAHQIVERSRSTIQRCQNIAVHRERRKGSIHDWGTKKECLTEKKITKDNFGFLFILYYYNYSGLLYAKR